MVHKKILQGRGIYRDTLLGKVNNQENNNKITFNITYHSAFQNARKILEEIHMILAPDGRYKKVFHDLPLIGLKKNKKFQGPFGKVAVTRYWRDIAEILKRYRRSKACVGKKPPCHLCKSMKDTFKSIHFDDVYTINNDHNWNSEMPVYFIESQVSCEQYTGSKKPKFGSKTNNYKDAHRKFMSKKEVPKQALNKTFSSALLYGKWYWHRRLGYYFDRQDWYLERVKQKRLKTYALYGLNKRKVYEAFWKEI